MVPNNSGNIGMKFLVTDRSGIEAFSDQVLRLAEAAKAAADRL